MKDLDEEIFKKIDAKKKYIRRIVGGSTLYDIDRLPDKLVAQLSRIEDNMDRLIESAGMERLPKYIYKRTHEKKKPFPRRHYVS